MSSNRRKPLPLKAKMQDVTNILRLLGKVPSCFKTTMQGRFGHVLDLLTVDVQIPAITALAQFYDPPLRSFLFQDFQLTPTLEEYDRLLGFTMKGRSAYNQIGQKPDVEKLALALHIPISDAIGNWKKKESFQGFWRNFLENEAEKWLIACRWDALMNILALLIYGLVLFPNYEGFIDSSAISVFWAVWKETQNLVHPLLADTFHTLHTRHEKRGGVLTCCLPLLYNWLIACVFKPNDQISKMSNEGWAKFLVSLTSNNIPWYRYKLNVHEVVINCGSFQNVPLIGSKGCINYNPMLALRQLGHPMRGKPDDIELEEIVLNDMGVSDPSLLHKIIRSWEKIHTKGSRISKAGDIPYQQWVAERVKIMKLPFSVEVSIPPRSLPPEPAPVSLEEVEELRAMVARLGRQNEDLQSQLNKTTGESMVLKRKIDKNQKLLEESHKKSRMEEDRKERVLECLDQANGGLESLHERLGEAEKNGQEWKRWWDIATKEKKEAREKFEAQIKELTELLKRSKVELEHECRRTRNVSGISIEAWQEKCNELTLSKKSLDHWKTQHQTLKSQSMNEKKQLDKVLKDYEETIKFLEHSASTYRDKFASLIRFCNEIAKDLPLRLEMAAEDVDEDTPSSISYFIQLIERMVKRFKFELKELQEREMKKTF